MNAATAELIHKISIPAIADKELIIKKLRDGDDYLASQDKEWGQAGQCYREAISLLEKQLLNLPTSFRFENDRSRFRRRDFLCCKIRQLLERIQHGRNSSEVGGTQEEIKDILLDVHLMKLQVSIEGKRPKSENSQQPKVTSHDMGTQVKSLIENTERRLKCYRFLNQKSLWNELEFTYDTWEILCLHEGHDYEAAEFNYAMMRARRYRLKADKDITMVRRWGEYVWLTIAYWSVGFGHRLSRGLLWVIGIVLLFSWLYCLGYDDLGIGNPESQSPVNFLGLATRYLHSLDISFAILFLPNRIDQINLQPTGHLLQFIVVFNQFLGYVVNVGLIALVVNKLAGRRKW